MRIDRLAPPRAGLFLFGESLSSVRHADPPTLRRCGLESRLVLGEKSTGVDRTLLKNIAQGWAWFEEIKAETTMQAIADRERMKQRKIAHLADLAFLAPDIVEPSRGRNVN